MKFILSIICFLGFNLVNSQSLNSKYFDEQDQQVYFDKPWKLRKVGDTSWISNVQFPNTIHEILFEKKIIEDPYIGNNEINLKWIEESDWEAEMEFDVFNEIPDAKHILYFESIEPYAKVYLNGNFLFESKNSFIPYEIEVTKFAKINDKNVLKIIFESPVKRAKQLAKENKIILPGEERVYTRKPQYEYGWDWGPRFVTTGIKKAFHYHRLPKDYLYFDEAKIINAKISDKKAVLNCELSIYSNIDQKITLNLNEHADKIKFTTTLQLKKGLNKFKKEIIVNHPHLWWPHNLGEPYTYNFNFSLTTKKNKHITQRGAFTIVHAITDIKLIQEKDSLGNSFYFKVNDVPVYLKGFNLIPFDHFQPYYAVPQNKKIKTENDRDYITNHIRNLNANAIRIWGGGVYPDDFFLLNCLQNGILIWQDFMFAGGMYPGDSSFLRNVEEEVTYHLKRFQNYQNIALLCGNNEIDEAWHNWGWQKQYNYSKEDSTKIWNDYVKLFHELIPSIVEKYNADVDYIPSSPEIGWGRKESMTQGDSHYWGVWWGKEPIETFEEKIPRFMSEFGMQAMPDLSTLRKVIPDSLMNFDSPEFKNHQKHPTGFETINYYLEKYLTVPDQLEEYSYATQLLQTITLQTAISAQRLSPKCMGTLIWQLNDTWPVTSWSVIDSEGKLKLAARYLEQDFSNVQIFQKRRSDKIEYYVVNDDLEANELEASIALFNFDGKSISDTSFSWMLKPGIHKIYEMEYSEENNFVMTSIKGGRTHNFKTFLTKDIRNYQFIKPEIDFKASEIEKKLIRNNIPVTEKFFKIEFSSNQLLLYFEFLDKTYIKNHEIAQWNSLPYDYLLAKKWYTVYLPISDFINEQTAIDYVKKNLKSLNHLMGK